jgi:hypothetical protein
MSKSGCEQTSAFAGLSGLSIGFAANFPNSSLLICTPASMLFSHVAIMKFLCDGSADSSEAHGIIDAISRVLPIPHVDHGMAGSHQDVTVTRTGHESQSVLLVRWPLSAIHADGTALDALLRPTTPSFHTVRVSRLEPTYPRQGVARVVSFRPHVFISCESRAAEREARRLECFKEFERVMHDWRARR